ncbi:HAMP domain-containing histidine kinase [Gracilibacillus caseinilyticus]|uniref:histidine kinase n=1 Tax=Gracilibacillus caseinilyticus TaxID=2932256 RepID=A0ABY4EYU7_9BACI|nr:HAMP domain-containing sensor histidine kinase [Gracilibacillus caseinilyticus]UOQ48809.1 HAMP domain-containing histidine kinase [Gracilibacillus caseinilyticus]
MKKQNNKKRSYTLSSFYNFLFYFLLTLTACSISILLYTRVDDVSGLLIEVYIIGNLILISLAISLIDSIRRKYTIEKPVRKILESVERISKGDFTIKIPSRHMGKMDEFDEIGNEINKMTDELAKLETLKTDFISNVSHEIKTPLAIIQNYANMQKSETLSEEQRIEYARTIEDASKRLTGLVTNILKLNKLENQQIYPDKEEYNISEQLRFSLLSFEEAWSEKNIEVHVDIDDAYLSCDENLLEIVWSNLISNAVKFTPPDGLIKVTLNNHPDAIEVQVQDNGCGIDEGTGKHIFDKFYQGDTSHAKEGNGLGLAMVKRVIDIIEGDLSVESELGKGTTFTVRIKKTLRGEYI